MLAFCDGCIFAWNEAVERLIFVCVWFQNHFPSVFPESVSMLNDVLSQIESQDVSPNPTSYSASRSSTGFDPVSKKCFCKVLGLKIFRCLEPEKATVTHESEDAVYCLKRSILKCELEKAVLSSTLFPCTLFHSVK